MGTTLAIEQEAARRRQPQERTFTQATFIWQQGEETRMFWYRHLVNEVVAGFNLPWSTLQELHVKLSGDNWASFERRPGGVWWVQAQMFIPFKGQKPNKFNHIDELIADAWLQRMRDRWLGEL